MSSPGNIGSSIAGFVATACLSGCASIGIAPSASISGAAVVRSTEPVPPDATFHVVLERRSDQEALPELVASIRQAPSGAPPFRFTFDRLPADSRKTHTYLARARVELHGELLLTTKARKVVAGKAGAKSIRLVLRKPPPEAPLMESYWALTELDSRPVHAPEPRRTAHLVGHPKRQRVIVFGTCNNMIGTVQARGQGLRFSPMPGKPVRCDPQPSLDEDLRRSLSRAVSWRVTGRTRLELLDSQGACTLKFARVERE